MSGVTHMPCSTTYPVGKKSSRQRIGTKQVLIPGYTCYSVAASVVKAGVDIRCYDLDPHTFWPDERSVQSLAGKNTLACFPEIPYKTSIYQHQEIPAHGDRHFFHRKLGRWERLFEAFIELMKLIVSKYFLLNSKIP